MDNKKLTFVGLLIFTLPFAILISIWDGAGSFEKEMAWVLRELPEVKSIELLEAIKKS